MAVPPRFEILEKEKVAVQHIRRGLPGAEHGGVDPCPAVADQKLQAKQIRHMRFGYLSAVDLFLYKGREFGVFPVSVFREHMHGPVRKNVSYGGNTPLYDLRRLVLSVQPQHPDVFGARLFPFGFPGFRAFLLKVFLNIGAVFLSEPSQHLIVDAKTHDLQRFLRCSLQGSLHQRIPQHMGLQVLAEDLRAAGSLKFILQVLHLVLSFLY